MGYDERMKVRSLTSLLAEILVMSDLKLESFDEADFLVSYCLPIIKRNEDHCIQVNQQIDLARKAHIGAWAHGSHSGNGKK
mmetsp:Transcript_18479/g.25963  ORF Transcript_18479/g.25963 Transcript_18479/m.25963 type:complete len:81 (-) Transcript_18479:307-549(-)